MTKTVFLLSNALAAMAGILFVNGVAILIGGR